MEALALVLAALFTLLFLAGWLMLLVMPLVVLTSTTVGGMIVGTNRLRHLLPGVATNAARGILVIDGLAAQATRRVREDLVRVLELASPETKARACVCVQPVDGAVAGVLRIFNTRGHYLFQTAGASADMVAGNLSAELGRYTDTFPAKVGARRPKCALCVPESCPLRRIKRERRRAVQAA